MTFSGAALIATPFKRNQTTSPRKSWNSLAAGRLDVIFLRGILENAGNSRCVKAKFRNKSSPRKCNLEWQRAAEEKCQSTQEQSNWNIRMNWNLRKLISISPSIPWDIWRRNFIVQLELQASELHVQQLFSLSCFLILSLALSPLQFGLLWLIRRVICKVIKVMSRCCASTLTGVIPRRVRRLVRRYFNMQTVQPCEKLIPATSHDIATNHDRDEN